MRGKGYRSVGDLSEQQVQDLESNSWHWRESPGQRRKSEKGEKKEKEGTKEGGGREKEEMKEERKEKNEWVND